MPTYKVTIPVTGSLTATVVAGSEKEAKAIAAGVHDGLCAQCSGYPTTNLDPADGDVPWSLDLDDIYAGRGTEIEEA